ADLEEILSARLAAEEDEDEEDEEEEESEKVEVVAKSSEEVQGRQKTEISCPHCFLLVEASVVADTGECSHCGAPIS
ncbi:MAG: hypothetical protein CL439_03150, partial [Acidimicrobiaceae bacterium]|nr:hypothetical protein [Acidimicrobiaceae bacterium]